MVEEARLWWVSCRGWGSPTPMLAGGTKLRLPIAYPRMEDCTVVGVTALRCCGDGCAEATRGVIEQGLQASLSPLDRAELRPRCQRSLWDCSSRRRISVNGKEAYGGDPPCWAHLFDEETTEIANETEDLAGSSESAAQDPGAGAAVELAALARAATAPGAA